jgi:prohibitin 2
VRALGEAESARLVNQAIRDNPNFVYLRKIEGARDIAKTISNGLSLCLLYLFASSFFVLFN